MIGIDEDGYDYVVKKLGENMDLNTIELKKSNKEHEHDRYHDSIQWLLYYTLRLYVQRCL